MNRAILVRVLLLFIICPLAQAQRSSRPYQHFPSNVPSFNVQTDQFLAEMINRLRSNLLKEPGQ